MKSTFCLLTTLIISLVLRTQADETIGLCCLCGGCAAPLAERALLAVDSSGTTCQQMSLNMADPSGNAKQGSGICRQLQSKWYDHCCNPSHTPTKIAQTTTVSPGAEYPSGNYESCGLCKNGQYPALDQTLVAVLDHPDVNTCKELYWYTKKGNFESRMCAPIQNYFEGPCGCKISGSNGNSGSSNGSTASFNGSSGSSSTSSGSTGGGAPDQSTGSYNQGSTSTNPAKKIVEESKEEDKLYAETDRGTIRRTKRRLKGSE